MTDYDSYVTNNDKPFAECINDALLLSNMFDLNVDIELPNMYSNKTWSVSAGNRKAGVAVVNVKEATGLSVTSVDTQSALTGTGTLKLGFYPNFNAFGGIDKISWTGTGTITCSIYSSSGSLITSVTNGETISITPTLSTLQNFEIRLTLSSATLQTVKVGMTNKEHTRYGAKITPSNVQGLTWTTIYHDDNYTILANDLLVNVQLHFGETFQLDPGRSWYNDEVFDNYNAYMPQYRQWVLSKNGLFARLTDNGLITIINDTTHTVMGDITANFLYPKKGSW